uniref:Uncharacterized protein n=1 Tax=Knipowitschia caucasica TaxID=637954 RepID=A0AAV2L2N6_KNICA
MDVKAVKEPEEELEDGEICDDETEERAPYARGDNHRAPGEKPDHRKANITPLMERDFRPMISFPHAVSRGPFPLGHRQQQCGPSGPERPVSPLTPGHEHRSTFWERSHCALGRFRHGRGGRGGGRGVDWRREGGRPQRYGPGENHSKNDSPSRKRILELRD